MQDETGARPSGVPLPPNPTRTRSLTEVALIAIAALQPVAYASPFLVPSWTPRMALMLTVLPLGCLALVSLARRRDPAAWAAMILMSACTLSTLIGDVPLWNLRGGFGRESSLLFMLGFFAVWSLARLLPAQAIRDVAIASCVGIGISGLVAVGQMIFDPSDGLFAMIGERPSGLHVNPVYFGAAVAGVGAMSAHSWARGFTAGSLHASVLLASSALVGYSGSRGASLALLLAVVGAVFVASSWKMRAWIGATWFGGIAVSAVPIPGLDSSDTVGRASVDADGRLDIWLFAWRAFLERPVRGYGLGQFRPAVQGHFTPEFVRSKAADVSAAAWPDAHNIVVQYAVVGGIAAALALLAFVYFAGRISSGPLAWAAMTSAFTWLLQPATLALAPIVALWLGLAASRKRPDSAADSETSTDRRPELLLMGGLIVALSLVALDVRLRRSADASDSSSFGSWAAAAPSDPVLANTAASLMTGAGRHLDSLQWREVATGLEPLDAVTRASLARQQLELGFFQDAVSSIELALEADPFNPMAIETAYVISVVSEDMDLAEVVESRRCAVWPETC